MTTQKPRLWVGNCGKEGKSPHGLRDNSPLSGETMGNQKRGVSVATDQSPKGAPALPRRLANRFLEVLPRGAKGFCLSIYLSPIQFIHLIPINECYIYIYISTYCRPIESYSKYYYPHISMISQLRGLQGARSADDESTKSAGKRAARAGDLLVV